MQEDHNQLVLLRTSADEISSRVEHLEKALSEKESQEKDKVSSSYMAPSRIPTAAAAAAGGVVAVGAGAAVGAAVASGKSAGSAVVTTSRALPSISADSVAQVRDCHLIATQLLHALIALFGLHVWLALLT